MKISYNWLKQFLKIDWDAEKTGELLTDLGLEVEGITPYQSIKGGLEGIVVGHVLTCVQHSNADKLRVTTVDIGIDAPLQIVCGAPNVAVGQKVAVATIGTTLYDDKGAEWKIKKGKIRGEESYGMLCAEDELGLGSSHDGILVLDNKLAPGTAVNDVFDVENDRIFEIGLTPNRADAMSHWGVARDLKAGLSQQKITTELITPSVSSFHVENRLNKIAISVKNHDLAPRYCGVTISNITVAPSPDWIQNRLKAIGITPKNNVVDITNYVLHELGQPLHAFDKAQIAGDKIEVKTLKAGTKFTTLDEVERTLHEDDLMICDIEKPLCIAGVFGGINSGVTEQTTAVFLESAFFDPVSIRKTAKRHGLNTDASFRFERGIDPNATKYALKRAALLIQEYAGGIITSDIDDLYPKKTKDYQVFLSFENTTKLIGEELPQETIKSILSSLEIKVNNITEGGIGLTIPAYRNDVQREADVIEEILRVYGYNNIRYSQKLNASISPVDKFEDYRLQNIIAQQLVAQGFNEMMANSLTTANYAAMSEQLLEEHNVTIINPLSQDLAVMRQSLLFSGLETIAYNINRKRSDLKFFEFGKTYHNYNGTKEELKHLSILITGNTNKERWNSPTQKTDFFLLKGVVIGILERLGIQKTMSVPTQNDMLKEGLALQLGKTKLVDFGIIKKKTLKEFGISQEVYYADFQWDAIAIFLRKNTIKFQEIPKFPEVRRDFALLLNEEVSFEAIHNLAKQQEKQVLKEIDLFDVYQGKNLPKGKKSYAVSFTLQDDKKTLTDKQIDKIMNKLQQSFEQKLGAQLR